MPDGGDPKQDAVTSSSDGQLFQFQLEKLQAEIAKLKVETGNLQRQSRSENLRFWIPIAAPFVGSVALVATLLFQVFQFNENARMTRQATEATQFREVLQNAQLNASKSGQAATSMIRLASFLDSRTFGADTRRAMIPLMVELAILGEFKAFHTRMFPRVQYSDLPDVVEISRIQSEIDDQSISRKNQAQNQLDQAKADVARKVPGAEARVSRLQSAYDKEEESRSAISEEIRIVSADILSALKQKPISESPDLSYTQIFDSDFAGVDFGSSDMTGMQIDYCDLSSSDLSKVRAFDGSHWHRTQCWLAKAISPELLAYLRKYVPFDSSTSYRGPSVTQADYDKRLTALGRK